MIQKPLAYRMRPKTLDQVIGQKKIKSFLEKLLESDSLLSMVFYGSPGTGKTTLAKAFAESFHCHSISLNAVVDNKAKMEQAFEEAIRFEPTIVIIDEIHRMDKGKQDILLPHLERGDFYLIGCTTANPLISLNPAIRSRTRLLEVERLTSDEILEGLKRAVISEDGLNGSRKFEEEALSYLAKISGGDLRFAYNQLEAVALSYSKRHTITKDDVTMVVTAPNYLSDKNDDEHYNTVSAFQKSIRGSEIDAAIYYLAKLIKSGDLEGIIRRLLVTAYEDIGLANPQAVDRAYHACQVALEVGLPEAAIPLGFTVVELAGSPKSKSTTHAIQDALELVDDSPIEVRDYLKLTRANVDEEEAYTYSEPEVWRRLEYLPPELVGTKFYHPNTDSKYEKAFADYLKANEKERVDSVKEARKRSKQS